jgi:hypothetical protein
MLTRRRQLSLVTGFLLTILMSLTLQAAPAHADPQCKVLNPLTGQCVITIPVPGDPGTGANHPPSPGGGTVTCHYQDGTVTPCYDPQYGYWNAPRESYCKRMVPQPPIGDSLWQGHPATDGAVYECMYIGPIPNFRISYYWSATAPGPTVTPAEAAGLVVRRMDLRAAVIGIVPENKPGSIGAVGAPVYMWTRPGPTIFGPQRLSGSVDGVSVTAVAKVDRIVWDMGDGNTVTCRTPGTPYADRFGFAMSPDCGYRYRHTSAGRPGNAYPVTATSYWLVDWTGPGGTGGQIPLTLTASTTIVVGELQALISR